MTPKDHEGTGAQRMDKRGKVASIGAAAGALGMLVLLGAVGLIIVYAGTYNVAATEEHASFTRWALDTTFRNSVERHAAEILPPEAVTPQMIAAGAASYKEMCQSCHGGPGVERPEWVSGMRPRPPHLVEAASEWELREVFWLVKHGAKMSGMPAFGPTHDDQAIWSIAAFVKQLPGMTPERYAADSGGDGSDGSAAQGGGAGSSRPQ